MMLGALKIGLCVLFAEPLLRCSVWPVECSDGRRRGHHLQRLVGTSDKDRANASRCESRGSISGLGELSILQAVGRGR